MFSTRNSAVIILSLLTFVSVTMANVSLVPDLSSPLSVGPGDQKPDGGNLNGPASDGPDQTIQNRPPIKTPEQVMTELHKLRVKKCRRIIESFYNYDGRANFGPHVDYFITYHEQLEREYLVRGDKRARGFGDAWWWSLVYGGANFGMTCYGVAPGNCAGPLDVKHYPLVLDPRANIRHHCREMFDYYLHNDVRDIDLCRWVMYPARPHDWGGGMFRRTNEKHMKDINRAYRFGKL